MSQISAGVIKSKNLSHTACNLGTVEVFSISRLQSCSKYRSYIMAQDLERSLR